MSNATSSKTSDIVAKRSQAEQLRQAVVRKAHKSFLTFVRYMNPNFSIAPHHRLLAEKLEALERGEIDRLWVSMPPRSGKSDLASYYFPAWCLGRRPTWELMSISYAVSLAEGFGRRVRNLVESPKFQEVFPNVKVKEDNRSAGRWETEHGGCYNAAGVGGGIAGKGANLALIDDPISEQDAHSETRLKEVNDWYANGLYQRLMPKARILVVMTRWSPNDLVGYLQEQEENNPFADKWASVVIPAILEPGYEAEAELLGLPMGSSYWPKEASDYSEGSKLPYKDLSELLRVKATMAPREWEAVYQQNPTPLTGRIFDPEWFQRWPNDSPPICHTKLISIDTAFGLKETNDYSVMQTWGVFSHENSNHLILLNQVKERMDFMTLMQRAEEQVGRFNPDLVLVEKKASGQSLIQMLQRRGIPIFPCIPDKDKHTRAHSASGFVATRKVWLPYEPYAEDFLHEVQLFGTPGVHDDAVDAFTQLVNFVVSTNLSSLKYRRDEDEDDELDMNYNSNLRFY